ncbi:MAG: ABC transporter permease [Gemmatimonadetes bacterium]|nr:ABC transporter permease [Gemmatimonadota bacterium]
MKDLHAGDRRTLGERCYAVLLGLYPRRFRRSYERQLLEAFSQRYRARPTGRARLWLFHLWDLARSVPREHWDVWRDALRGWRARDGVTGREWMSTVVQDLTYALRSLRRSPGFMVVVVVTLGLGIGLNTAIFSIVNGVLLRPLPYPDADRLVWGYSTFSGGNNASVSPPDYLDYRAENTVFTHLAARRGQRPYALTGMDRPLQGAGQEVSAGFFEALGGVPVVGRTFTVEDERIATNRVAVLSYGFWQRMFAGSDDVLDQAMTLDGETYHVVGVMPPGFRLFNAVDFWTPIGFDADFAQVRRFHFLRLVGRLRDDVSLERAQAELDVISKRLEEAYPASNATWRLVVVPLHQVAVSNVRPALLLLLGAVGLVLLIACGNVANLLLARGAARHSELAVRTALGASRRRVLRQLLTESIMLALIGGIVGSVLAVVGVGALQALQPRSIPRLDEVAVDGMVLAFAFGLSVITGVVFGLLPSLSASKLDVNAALKEGGRSGAGRGDGMRAGLVVSEVALSLILLIGAGLLIESFWRLSRVDPGFDVRNAVTTSVALPSARYETDEQRIAFYDAVRERLRSTPGVVDVAVTSNLPLGGGGNDTYLAVPGRHQLGTESQFNAQNRSVSANFFDVMQTPLLQGRQFTSADRDGTPNVVIINEPFANTIFPDESPIGQRLQIDLGDVYEAEIVGVVGGINHFSLGGQRPAEFYLPLRQSAFGGQNLIVRTSVDPLTVTNAIPRIVSNVDPLLPVSPMFTYEELVANSIAQPRFAMLILGLFAAVALVLAGVGIYGVLGYYVAQRTKEVGLRVALGAKNGDVLRLVVGRGMGLTALGLLVGVIGAFGLTRFMSSLLFGVGATDPVTFMVPPVVLALIALLASYLPARRATRIAPIAALKTDG